MVWIAFEVSGKFDKASSGIVLIVLVVRQFRHPCDFWIHMLLNPYDLLGLGELAWEDCVQSIFSQPWMSDTLPLPLLVDHLVLAPLFLLYVEILVIV